jgi:hypothetical protein
MASRSNLESRSYGTPIQPKIRTGGPAARNTVGEADSATRRRALDSRLSEREPAGSYKAPPSKIRREPQVGVSPNAMRLLRDRGRQIDGEVKQRDK